MVRLVAFLFGNHIKSNGHRQTRLADKSNELLRPGFSRLSVPSSAAFATVQETNYVLDAIQMVAEIGTSRVRNGSERLSCRILMSHVSQVEASCHMCHVSKPHVTCITCRSLISHVTRFEDSCHMTHV